jgi:hypothetical protein
MVSQQNLKLPAEYFLWGILIGYIVVLLAFLMIYGDLGFLWFMQAEDPMLIIFPILGGLVWGRRKKTRRGAIVGGGVGALLGLAWFLVRVYTSW